jgi:hypothetical protein
VAPSFFATGGDNFNMAHTINMQMPKTPVNISDVEFRIKQDGKLLGTLNISKGNLEWVPAGHSKRKFKVRWGTFDALMRQHGREGEIH